MSVREPVSEVAATKLSGMHIGRSASAMVYIDASPDEVWQAVSDVGSQHLWSCEATRCEWISPADRAELGARFRGCNRRGFRHWTRENEVTEADSGSAFGWRTLPCRLYPDSTDWRIELTPSGPGTEVIESYEIRSINRAFEIFMFWFNPGHRERRSDLEADLRRLKAHVEGNRH